jgi:hypothetical protein
MKFTTKSGKQIELKLNGKVATAFLDGKELGVVSKVATQELGWHLTTGSVAITVKQSDQETVKQFLASWAPNVPPTQKEIELKQYYDDHQKVLDAMTISN